MITQEYLQSIIDYNINTGEFYWKKQKQGRKISKIINTLDRRGYVVIKIDRVQYLAHRLAWLYMTGEWPENEIDHKDLNKSNNKWENLREANRQENNRNRRMPKNNTTGFKGVYKVRDKYIARIQHNGIKFNLGTYGTKEEAFAAYKIKADELHKEYKRLK